jgi:hypothetical protein
MRMLKNQILVHQLIFLSLENHISVDLTLIDPVPVQTESPCTSEFAFAGNPNNSYTSELPLLELVSTVQTKLAPLPLLELVSEIQSSDKAKFDNMPEQPGWSQGQELGGNEEASSSVKFWIQSSLQLGSLGGAP